MVFYLVDNLSKGQTYFYRWMASNSVSSGVWSLPPQDGIKGWWKFDESSEFMRLMKLERILEIWWLWIQVVESLEKLVILFKWADLEKYKF